MTKMFVSNGKDTIYDRDLNVSRLKFTGPRGFYARYCSGLNQLFVTPMQLRLVYSEPTVCRAPLQVAIRPHCYRYSTRNL